jgi:hypothetical protein
MGERTEAMTDIRELIERGSLGTPEAKAIRATVSPEQVAKVMARVAELERTDEAGRLGRAEKKDTDQ